MGDATYWKIFRHFGDECWCQLRLFDENNQPIWEASAQKYRKGDLEGRKKKAMSRAQNIAHMQELSLGLPGKPGLMRLLY